MKEITRKKPISADVSVRTSRTIWLIEKSKTYPPTSFPSDESAAASSKGATQQVQKIREAKEDEKSFSISAALQEVTFLELMRFLYPTADNPCPKARFIRNSSVTETRVGLVGNDREPPQELKNFDLKKMTANLMLDSIDQSIKDMALACFYATVFGAGDAKIENFMRLDDGHVIIHDGEFLGWFTPNLKNFKEAPFLELNSSFALQNFSQDDFEELKKLLSDYTSIDPDPLDPLNFEKAKYKIIPEPAESTHSTAAPSSTEAYKQLSFTIDEVNALKVFLAVRGNQVLIEKLPLESDQGKPYNFLFAYLRELAKTSDDNTAMKKWSDHPEIQKIKWQALVRLALISPELIEKFIVCKKPDATYTGSTLEDTEIDKVRSLFVTSIGRSREFLFEIPEALIYLASEECRRDYTTWMDARKDHAFSGKDKMTPELRSSLDSAFENLQTKAIEKLTTEGSTPSIPMDSVDPRQPVAVISPSTDGTATPTKSTPFFASSSSTEENPVSPKTNLTCPSGKPA